MRAGARESCHGEAAASKQESCGAGGARPPASSVGLVLPRAHLQAAGARPHPSRCPLAPTRGLMRVGLVSREGLERAGMSAGRC